jgi:hypothetical protein
MLGVILLIVAAVVISQACLTGAVLLRDGGRS